ncbi:MAG: hypothetical protein EOM06_14405 [Sphingobacteriia bacterium]|nr:hypothetical protein [Sphingobacteriia bacterium]
MAKKNSINSLIKEAEKAGSKEDFGGAINALNRILEIDPDNARARTLLDYYLEIVRFMNMDIFASTNLFMDPWLD